MAMFGDRVDFDLHDPVGPVFLWPLVTATRGKIIMSGPEAEIKCVGWMGVLILFSFLWLSVDGHGSKGAGGTRQPGPEASIVVGLLGPRGNGGAMLRLSAGAPLERPSIRADRRRGLRIGLGPFAIQVEWGDAE